MISNDTIDKSTIVPLPAVLGLDRMPPGPRHRDRFFFKSPLVSQRLSILNNMVGSRSLVIVVIGERGSGKTTLMNEFISSKYSNWQPCRIKMKSRSPGAQDRWRNLNNRMVFRSKEKSPPSIIVDDAHELTQAEMKKLLGTAFTKEGHRKIQSIVLFARPEIRERFVEITRHLPPMSVVDKIYMTPFTEKQTADYLWHRIKAAGYVRKNPFTVDQIRKIHQLSGGLPGLINGEAFMILKRAAKYQPRFRRSLLAKWTKSLLGLKYQIIETFNTPDWKGKFGFHFR